MRDYFAALDLSGCVVSPLVCPLRTWSRTSIVRIFDIQMKQRPLQLPNTTYSIQAATAGKVRHI